MKRFLHPFALLCALVVTPAGAQVHVGPASGSTAPASLLAPRRIIVPCQGPRGAVVEFTVALPDSQDTNATIECRPPSGSMFSAGTNTVTCVSTDAAGSGISTAFPVIVVGGCAVDDCIELEVPEDIHARGNTAGGATVEFKVTASERCTGGPVTVACGPPAGSLFPVGLTRVVCTAQAGDKRASASFLVEVNDDRPPEIQCPTNLVVEAQSPLGAIVRYEITGQDDCAAQVRVRCSPPSGSVFPVGDTRVFCQAADGNGNSRSCAFMVKANPARPLRVRRLDSNQVELRWTGDAVLEGTDVLGEDSPWQEITDAPQFDGVERVLQLPASTRQSFFRTRPMPLLPPADHDGDGVPDSLDYCPDTPHGLAVDEHGCSVLELVATPEAVLGPEREALAKTLGEVRLEGSFSNLAGRLQTQLAPSNNPALLLRSRELAGASGAQSNLVSELRRAATEFPREMALRLAALQQGANPLDPAHADVRPEDFEIRRLEEIGTGLTNGLRQAERTLTALSNLVQATSVRPTAERVRIASFDNERGAARLEDGRCLLLPRTLSEAAPPIDQIPGVFHLGSSLELEASPLPDGSWFGFELQPETEVSSELTLGLDPTCLRLRVVPAHPALPAFDFGTRHHLGGYKWGFTEALSRHYLEFGMAFAVEKVNSFAEAPGTYVHTLYVFADGDNNGSFYFLTMFDGNSPAFVLKTSDLPKFTAFPILVREFRRPIRRDQTLGAAELLKEETYLIEINDYASYAQAEYSRTIFEIEDAPNETGYQPAQVMDLDRQWPLTLQPLAQQTFTAQSYKVTVQGSSYPDLYDVHLNELFAVQVQDPNEQGLFASPKDMGRGLYEPTINGFNHGRPFTYRVALPSLVRDRLHHCFEGAPDSYYRIPFHGPLGNNQYGAWHVSQGNNGGFTHTNKGRYAFDFPAKQGTPVLAARGGIVIKTWESSYKSCWDPDFDDGDGIDGGCTDCYCEKSANFVSILHQDGTIGVYFHFKLNGVVVSPGQRVFRGDTIGYVGNTGCSTAPHLHLEVRKPDGSETIPILFECWNDDALFRGCYLPPHDSDGFSTNKPWWWPF